MSKQVLSPVVLSPLPSSCLFLTVRTRQLSLLHLRIVSAQNMQRSVTSACSHPSILHEYLISSGCWEPLCYTVVVMMALLEAAAYA